MSYRRFYFVIPLVMLAGSGTAQAATGTSTLAVGAIVTNTCLVVTVPLTFGSYNLVIDDLQITGSINVTCTSGVAYDIGLDAGTGTGASVDTRKMTLAAGEDTLNYGLYRDAAHSSVWGNEIGVNTLRVDDPSTGVESVHTVYGKIPKGQAVPAGVYADTVNVTVTY